MFLILLLIVRCELCSICVCYSVVMCVCSIVLLYWCLCVVSFWLCFVSRCVMLCCVLRMFLCCILVGCVVSIGMISVLLKKCCSRCFDVLLVVFSWLSVYVIVLGCGVDLVSVWMWWWWLWWWFFVMFVRCEK